MLLSYSLLFLSGLLSSFLSGVAGHGGALLLLPVLSFIYPGSKAIFGIVMIYYFAMNLSRLYIYRKSILWWIWWPLTVGALLTVSLGAWSIERLSFEGIQLVLGLFVVTYVAYESRTGSISPSIRPADDRGGVYRSARGRSFFLFLVGLPYGFLSGLLSSGSVVRTPALLRLGILKEEFIATTSASSLPVNISKIFLYSHYGFLTTAVLPRGFLLATAAVVGTALSRHLLLRLSPGVFRKLVLGMLFFIGLSLIGKGV